MKSKAYEERHTTSSITVENQFSCASYRRITRAQSSDLKATEGIVYIVAPEECSQHSCFYNNNNLIWFPRWMSGVIKRGIWIDHHTQSVLRAWLCVKSRHIIKKPLQLSWASGREKLREALVKCCCINVTAKPKKDELIQSMCTPTERFKTCWMKARKEGNISG